jgi:hypothetical protein
MVKLNDLVGTILNDMARARVEADIESLRIAEMYSKNELLKTMPIPRMRLKNFTVTLPIAIDKLDENSLDEARKPLTTEVISSNSFKTLSNVLSRSSIDLSGMQIRNLKSRLKDGLVRISNDKPWIITQEKALSDEIVTLIKPFIKKLTAELLDDDELKNMIGEFRKELRYSLTDVHHFLPNLDVIVDTSSLQNFSNEEKLVHLTLNVDETGLEWSVYESTSGETRERLVPE